MALACGDANDTISYIKKAEKVLLQVWSFFDNSPKKSAAYPKAVLAVKQLSVSNRGKKKLREKFQKACRSRWLLTEKATEGVYQDCCSKHFEFSKKMKMQLLLGYYSKKPT